MHDIVAGRHEALFPSRCFPFLINPQKSGLFSYRASLEHLRRVYRAAYETW